LVIVLVVIIAKLASSLTAKERVTESSSMETLFLRQRMEALEEKVKQLAYQVQTLQPKKSRQRTRGPSGHGNRSDSQSSQCRACWAPMESDAEFCDQCGTALKNESAASAKPAPPSPVAPAIKPPFP